MRMFRPLTASEIECRISEVKKTDKGGGYCKLLLYKTARTDAALLDDHADIGPFNWQCDYRTIDGKMYCGIGIKSPSSNEWIWKWNVGTESNTEAEKGEASDALKRAGFVWGIGTELYSAPEITVWEPKCKITESNGKARCYDKFTVGEIGYDDNERINRLVIHNAKTGAVAFEMGEYRKLPEVELAPPPKPKKEASPKKETPKTEGQPQFATDEQMKLCFDIFDMDEINSICNHFHVDSMRKMKFVDVEQCINKRLKQLEKKNGEAK